MTFDEAGESLVSRTDFKELTIPVADVDEILDDLRVTYAPIVKMTRKQFEQFIESKKQDVYFATFIFNRGRDELSEFEAFKTPPEHEIELEKGFMNAWLHPELIKVVN